MAEHSVKVHIYDLSKGLARSLSSGLLGRQIDGIWHTGIVVYGKEYFFGGDGIMNCNPCGTVLGRPDTSIDLGVTQVPHEMFLEYLEDLSTSTYSIGTYHLLDHNCNTFSNEIAQFLTGNPIPSYITNLPQEVLNTPFGAMIRPMLDSIQVNPTNGDSRLFASNSSGSESKSSCPTSAKSTVAGNLGKPIMYDDCKVVEGFTALGPSIKKKVTDKEFELVTEVVEYVQADSCQWSLGSTHIKVLVNLVQHSGLSDKQMGIMCGLLRISLLKNDVIAYVTHDLSHLLMNLFREYDSMCRQVQLSLVRAACNISCTKVGQVWMMSPEEWEAGGELTSNSKISMKVCVTSLLHDDLEITKSGASLAYNFTYYKVSKDIAVELGSALIQSLIKVLKPPAPEVSLAALEMCMKTSSEVTGLAAVMGLDVNKFATLSPKCADVCRKIKHLVESFSI